MRSYDKAPHSGTVIADLLTKVDETLAHGASALPTKECRRCGVPKSVNHFSPAEWARDTKGSGKPVCRGCVKAYNEATR
jgi:hypothetical protein